MPHWCNERLGQGDTVTAARDPDVAETRCYQRRARDVPCLAPLRCRPLRN
jgi:hypothetical protein